MSTVKKQHYVWRNYLRPWADNEKIQTYFIAERKIELINLMGVAQQRYFYKLIDLTGDEELFLKEFIKKSGDEADISFYLTFLELFTITSKMKKDLDKEFPIKNDQYENLIKELEINLMEQAHGMVENLGFKLINYRNIDDLKTIEKDDYMFDAIFFLCVQYFRTKNIQKAVQKTFQGNRMEELAKKLGIY